MQRPSQMDRNVFVARFGGVFEHSRWVAEAAFEAGLGPDQDTAAGLHAAMEGAMRAAPRARQLALIRAHPDLAGRLAVGEALSDASAREQAGAGLDRCTPEEFERFQRSNAAYKERFGFPFVIAVKGRSRAEILSAFERRLGHDREVEFETALGEIAQIARFRLDAML